MLWAGSSSASARSAPATVAWGAWSPPMASNAIRAKVRLPWRLLAAHPRSTRTPRRRGAAASSPDSADTSGSQSRALPCACCGRASFSWMFCASGRPWVGTEMRVRSGGAVAGAEVELGPTRRTQTLTVFPAQHVAWDVQQPLLPERGAEIELRRARVEQVDIGIVLDALRPRLGEDDVRVFGHMR